MSRVECCNLIARAHRSVGGESEGKGRYRERPASDRGSSSDDASRASGDASWAVLWLPDALRGRRAAAVAVEVSGLRRLCGLGGGCRAGGAPPAVRGSAAAEAQPGRPARRLGCGVRPGDLDGAGQAVMPAVRRDADPDGLSRIESVRAGRCRRPESGSASSRSRCCERPAADVRRCRACSAAAARSTACRDLVVVEGNLLCGETRGPGPGLAAGQCPAVRTAKGRTVRDHDPLQNCRSSKATREEVTVDEPTSAEWVIGEWVTLDRELHPFEAAGVGDGHRGGEAACAARLAALVGVDVREPGRGDRHRRLGSSCR